MIDFLSNRLVKSRKLHVCDQCGTLIGVGETYRRQVYKDGDVFTHKAHSDCYHAAQMMRDAAELYHDDGICLCNDVQLEDAGWLWTEFPNVAERLGLKSPSWVKIWSWSYGW